MNTVGEGSSVNPVLKRLYDSERIMAGDREVVVYNLDQEANFMKMYGSLGINLEDLWVTYAQREAFCEEHRDKVSRGGGTTLFLHKKKEARPATTDNLSVTEVLLCPGGMFTHSYPFEGEDMRDADSQVCVVVPQF